MVSFSGFHFSPSHLQKSQHTRTIQYTRVSMKQKLTLTVAPEIVQKAKKMARERGGIRFTDVRGSVSDIRCAPG